MDKRKRLVYIANASLLSFVIIVSVAGLVFVLSLSYGVRLKTLGNRISSNDVTTTPRTFEDIENSSVIIGSDCSSLNECDGSNFTVMNLINHKVQQVEVIRNSVVLQSTTFPNGQYGSNWIVSISITTVIGMNYLVIRLVMSDLLSAKRFTILEFRDLLLFADEIARNYLTIENASKNIIAIVGTDCVYSFFDSIISKNIPTDSLSQTFTDVGLLLMSIEHDLKGTFFDFKSLYNGLWMSSIISSMVCVILSLILMFLTSRKKPKLIKVVPWFDFIERLAQDNLQLIIFFYGFVGIIVFAFLSAIFVLISIILTDMCIDPVGELNEVFGTRQLTQWSATFSSTIDYITQSCDRSLILHFENTKFKGPEMSFDEAFSFISHNINLLMAKSVEDFTLLCSNQPYLNDTVKEELSEIVSSVNVILELLSSSCSSILHPIYTHVIEDAVCSDLNAFSFISSVWFYALSLMTVISMVCIIRQ